MGCCDMAMSNKINQLHLPQVADPVHGPNRSSDKRGSFDKALGWLLVMAGCRLQLAFSQTLSRGSFR